MRNAATKIIEDFMLCANETIAEEFYWREIPFLYRIHEIPDHEKIDKLQVFLQNFGIYLKSSHDEIHPKEVQKLLTKIEGTPEEPLISRLTLRSMKQANILHTALCILDCPQDITAILHHRSEDIQIFRSTGSLRKLCIINLQQDDSVITMQFCQK